jgi:putative oxidoreductase
MNSWTTWRAQALEPIVQRANQRLQDFGLLGLRLFAGQEFLLAGWTKLSGGLQPPDWFAGLAFPFPHGLLGPQLNWLVAGAGELLLGAALMLGLFSRLAALGLLYITYIAVYTVHFDLGWAGWNQIETEQGLGFKVPLMLGLMLLAIVTQGGGQYALDTWRRRVSPQALRHRTA